MEVSTFLPFSSLSTFGPRGIIEGFLVPFLIWICMYFLFVFVFIFLLLMTSIIFHSKCMHLWGFVFSHIDELVLLLCQRLDKGFKGGHHPGGSRGEPY
jgi:hypothetical protein